MEDLLKRLEKHCMFRASRLDGGGEVYGSLVADASAVPLLHIEPVTVWHIVQWGHWAGKPITEDHLIDPETVAMYLGKDDENGRGIYVPLKDVAAALEDRGKE